jgi:hypothetical protein
MGREGRAKRAERAKQEKQRKQKKQGKQGRIFNSTLNTQHLTLPKLLNSSSSGRENRKGSKD